MISLVSPMLLSKRVNGKQKWQEMKVNATADWVCDLKILFDYMRLYTHRIEEK